MTNRKKPKTIDILTGEEAVSVYFDPKHLVAGHSAPLQDCDWTGEMLYIPSVLVKEKKDKMPVVFT